MPITGEERYKYDPEFRTLVDVIYSHIAVHAYTPSEVRDAAMLAANKYETVVGRQHYNGC